MARFRAGDLVVETKPDLTPVTEADRAVEEMIRERLARDRPGDAILGEEFGTTRRRAAAALDRRPDRRHQGLRPRHPGVGDAASRSSVDGELVVGVVSAPALGSRWSAARGRGAHARRRTGRGVEGRRASRTRTWPTTRSTRSSRSGSTREFLALARRCWRARGFGDFWAHMLVADGSIDIAVEVGGLAVWDLAAVRVVVEEAGGRCTDLARRRTHRHRRRDLDERVAARRRRRGVRALRSRAT